MEAANSELETNPITVNENINIAVTTCSAVSLGKLKSSTL